MEEETWFGYTKAEWDEWEKVGKKEDVKKDQVKKDEVKKDIVERLQFRVGKKHGNQ